VNVLWLPAGSKVPLGMRRHWAAYRPGLPDPAGAWELNEGSGSLVNDSSGHGNTGTLTNMDPATDWVATPRGVGLDFDGSNDNLVTALTPIAYSQVTVVADVMMRWPGAGSTGRVATFTGQAPILLGTDVTTASKARFIVTSGGSAHTILSPTGAILDKVYNRWAGVWDGNAVSLYLNGVSQATPVDATGDMATIPGPWRLMHSDGYTNGVLRSFHVFLDAFTVSQVLALEGEVPIWQRQRYLWVSAAALEATATVADLAAAGVQATGANQSALEATATVADLAAAGVQATGANQSALEATATVADIAVAGVQAAGVRQDSLAATATTADLLATAVNAIGVREDALEAFALTADAVAAGVDASAAAVIPRVPVWRIREYIDEFTEVDRDNHLAVTADAISWWTVPPPPHGPDWNWAYIYGPHRLRDNVNVRTTATYEEHSSFFWAHKAYIFELYAAAPPNFYPEVAVYYEYFSSTLMGCWLAARSTNQAVRLGSTVSRGIQHRVTLHKRGVLATAEFENWTGTEWGTPATASVDCAPDPLPILTVARFESWPPGANPPGVPICVMGPLEVQLQAVRPRPIEFGTFALGR